MTKLGSILKSKDIILLTKVHIVKAVVFPLVVYECESWTIKKTEHWRADAFELWCWRRLLRVPWTARRSNQSIIKEISPEYLFEEMMLKTKLQSFGHLMWRTDSLAKTLMLGKIWKQEEKGITEDEIVWWYQRLDRHEFEQALGVADNQASLAWCSAWGHKDLDMTSWLNWTDSQEKHFIYLLKNNCLTEFCHFLSKLNMNQPWVYICPLPLELPSHLPFLIDNKVRRNRNQYYVYCSILDGRWPSRGTTYLPSIPCMRPSNVLIY